MNFIRHHLRLVVGGVLLAAAATAAALYWSAPARSQPCFATPATAARHTYTCPMHPEVVREAPGDCPKCGMALVAARAASASHTDCKHEGASDGCCPQPAATQMRLPPGHPPIPMKLPAGHPPPDGWQTNQTPSSARKPTS